MKIRRLIWLRLAAFLVSWLVKWWIGTLYFRYRALCPNLDPRNPGMKEKYIYAFWHENLLLLAYHFGNPKIQVLISQHADGELIARVCRHMGFGTIRGSTTRGGVEALLQMVRASFQCNLAVVPDGPRGPRRSTQLGLVYLASRTGLPIVAVGIGYDRPWRANSWDRLALPRPWSRARTVTSEPLCIPRDLGKEKLEDYRLLVARAMDEVSGLAEQWARTGRWPIREPSAPLENKDPGIAA